MKVKKLLGVVILTIGLIAVPFWVNKASADTPIVSTVEAESMNLPAGASVYSATTASGGQAVQMVQNGSLTFTVDLAAASESLIISARSNYCRGWADMSAYLDGARVFSTRVTTNTVSWNNYTINRQTTPGPHTLRIDFTNAQIRSQCARTLYVDKTVFYGAEDTTPPPAAPTVSLTANPSTVDLGSASILSWTSANTDTCSAAGSWSGDKPLSGSESTGELSANQTYTLTCSGPGGVASQSAIVAIASVTPPPPPGGGCSTADTSGCVAGTTLLFTNQTWVCKQALSAYGPLPVKVTLDYTAPIAGLGADLTTGCAGDNDPATIDLILEIKGDGATYGPGDDAVKVRLQAGYTNGIQITGYANCGPRTSSTNHQDGIQAQGGRDISFVDFKVGNYDSGTSTCQGAGGAMFYSNVNSTYATDIDIVRGKYIACVRALHTGSSGNNGEITDASFRSGRTDGTDPICNAYTSSIPCAGTGSVTMTNSSCQRWDPMLLDWL